MTSVHQTRGGIVLYSALALLLYGNQVDPRRAMVAVDFRTLRRGGEGFYVDYKHRTAAVGQYTFPDTHGLLYAVTRTPRGQLAVHAMPSGTGKIGARQILGHNNTRSMPPPNAKPMRTFASITAAIKFMSAQGRAYPDMIRSVGLGPNLFRQRDDPARTNKKVVAATAIQSAFRGWRARRNVYSPPTATKPGGGVAYQAAMRQFNAAARR